MDGHNESNIHQHFLRELIEEKRVAFQPELYRMYFNRIFPNWNEFANFLKASNEQERLECAKRVIDRLNFSSNFPIVEDIYASLIQLESEKLAGKEDFYVGRDHFVHTVNVYILGIYLFFNHPVFHTTLMRHFFGRRRKENPFETKNQLAVKSFISAWKYFACAHDIGYPFEALIDGYCRLTDNSFEPIFQQYAHLHEYQAYAFVVRIMAKLIYSIFQFKNARRTLKDVVEDEEDNYAGQWSNTIVSDNKQYPLTYVVSGRGKNFVQLEYTQTYEGLKLLMPLIKKEDVILLLRDEGGEPLALSYIDKGNEVIWMRVGTRIPSDAQLSSIRSFGSDEFPSCTCTCSYFVQKPMERLNELLKHTNLDYYGEALEHLAVSYFTNRYELFADLSTGSEEGEEIVYRIYRDIMNRLPLKNWEKGFAELWSTEYQDPMDQELKSVFIKIVADAIQETDLKNVNSIDKVKTLKAGILKKLKSNAQLDGVTKRMDETSKAVQEETMWLDFLYMIAKEALQSEPEVVTLKKESGDPVTWRIYCDLLCEGVVKKESSMSRLYQEILDRMEEKLRNAGHLRKDQSITDLTAYKRERSAYDHGLVGATFLLSTIVNYRKIAGIEDEGQKKLLQMAWDVEPDRLEASFQEKSLQILTESIYAVMLHNLYQTDYAKILKNDLMYTLEQDPFTYLGLLCDGLQVWDRIQQIKPAERSPEAAIDGEQFDLRIWDKKIYLISPLACVDQVKRKCQDLSSYLRGGETMVIVSTSAEPHLYR